MSEDDRKKIGDATGVDDPLDALGNLAVQTLTMGIVGLDGGKVSKGVVTRGVDESVGELSGRNAERKAIMESKDALAEEKKRRLEQTKLEDVRKGQQDLNASVTAQAVRKSSGSKNYLGAEDPEKDFLGL